MYRRGLAMNRLEFLHALRIDNADFAETVHRFFDQFMALYSIIGNYDISIANEDNLTFTIALPNAVEVNGIIQNIIANGYMVCIYDRMFRIAVNYVNGNIFNITIL